MSDYKFFLNIDDVSTEFHPLIGNASLVAEKTDVKNRYSVEGSLKFGGNGKENEFDLLFDRIDLGKIDLIIQERNFVTDAYEDYPSDLKLLMDGDWNLETKEVALKIESFDPYNEYYEKIDRKISTINTYREPIANLPINWTQGIVCPIYSFFEFEYSDTIPSGEGWESFIPQGTTTQAWCREGIVATRNVPLGSQTLDIWQSDGNKSYKSWSFRNVNLQTHAVFYGGSEKPEDNKEWIFCFEVFNENDNLTGTYWIEKSNINYIAYDNTYIGGRFLKDVIKDLIITKQRDFGGPDVISLIDLSIFETIPYLANAIVFPAGSITNENDFKDMSLKVMNELLEDLLHAYVRIEKTGFTDIIATYMFIKNQTYDTQSIDLTDYLGKNFAKNRSQYSTITAQKPPRIEYNMKGYNDDFIKQDVTFDLGIAENETEEIKIDKWATDVRDCQQGDTSEYKGRFFLMGSDESKTDLFTILTNDPSPSLEIPLLDGNPWVSTTNTSWVFNGIGTAHTNTFTLKAGETVRIKLDSPLDGTVLFHLYKISFGVVNLYSEIVNGATEEQFAVPSDGDYRMDVINQETVDDAIVDNFQLEKVIYTVRTGIGSVTGETIENAELSLGNLLENHIAEMPYDKANFNGNTDVLVHKSLDKKNVKIKYHHNPKLSSFDLDKNLGLELYNIAPTKLTRNLNGSLDELEGYVLEDPGVVFSTVVIGTQEWSAENINYNDGGSGIEHVNLDSDNDDAFGLIYTYDAAERIANLVDGYRLPTKAEWDILISFVGGSSVAGEKLKSEELLYWDATNIADNAFGFNARGSGQYNGTIYQGFKTQVDFWSSTDHTIPNSKRTIRFLNSYANSFDGITDVTLWYLGLRLIKE